MWSLGYHWLVTAPRPQPRLPGSAAAAAALNMAWSLWSSAEARSVKLAFRSGSGAAADPPSVSARGRSGGLRRRAHLAG